MAVDGEGGLFWSPTNPLICYAHHPAAAVANRRKLWKSIDSAATFAPINNAATATRTNRSIGVLPSGRVIFGLSTEIAPDNNTAIAYSDDEGITWTVVQVSATAAHARYRCMAPISGSIVLMLTGAQCYRSVDGGATWTNPLSATAGRTLDFIFVDPTTGFVFIPEFHQANLAAYIMWRSTDRGATFANVDSIGAAKTGDANSALRSMIVRTAVGRLLFICLVGGTAVRRQSTNDGLTWSTYSPALNVRSAAYRVGTALISWNGTSGAIARSIDDGATWADTALNIDAVFLGDFATFTPEQEEPSLGLLDSATMGFLLNARIRRRRRLPGER